MTQRSVNEVQALCTKAARGAGAWAGQANDFGAAAVHHLARDGSPETLTLALQSVPLGPICKLPLFIQAHLEDASTRLDASRPLMQAYLDATPYAAALDGTGGFCIDAETLERPRLPARLTVDEAHWEIWVALAEKTFVPETAQSRAAGAGAGLTDND